MPELTPLEANTLDLRAIVVLLRAAERGADIDAVLGCWRRVDRLLDARLALRGMAVTA